jgi:helicase
VRQIEQLLPPGAVVQRRDKASAQDVIVPLAQKLVAQGQKVIVFRNIKGFAEGCAAYLARDLGLPPADEAISLLPTHDLSGASERLRLCLQGGVAFHDTNLVRDERLIVERMFREPDSLVRVMAATTTVAAGVNTPASTVILAEHEFVGEDGRPFTVAEYKNMAGRAGRLGFNEKGTAIILADAEHPRYVLFNKYVAGVPEALRSSFTTADISTWLLRLLTQIESMDRAQVPSMLSRTYAGFCLTRQDPGWAECTRLQVDELLKRMAELGLLEEEEERVHLSLLGRACGQSALSFQSAMRLVSLLRGAGALAAEQLVALVQALPEADALATPIVRGRVGEPEWVNQAATLYGHAVVQRMQAHASDARAYQARCKRACVLHEWLNGSPIMAIEQRFSRNAFSAITFGTIRGFVDGTRYWLGSAVAILQLVLVGAGPASDAVERLLCRLELGVPETALPLTRLPVQLARGEYLGLVGAGLTSPESVWQAGPERLTSILSKRRAEELLALAPAKEPAAKAEA